MIEADLHERYGIDITAPVVDCEALRGRSWPWLRTRISSLLTPGTRTHRAVYPDAYKPRR